MGKFSALAGMVLAAVLLFAQPCKADSTGTMNYELTGNNWDLTFSLPQTFTPTEVTWNGILQVHNITGSLKIPAAYTFSTIQLGTAGWNQNTNYWAFGSATKSLAIAVPGLFTWNADGTVTLNEGTFVLGDYKIFSGAPMEYILTATDPPGGSPVSTPEPASLVLLGIGAMAAIVGIRRRILA